jgi:tRNA threonylcarbamoyl adenosine modification protein YeaZ
VILAFDTSTKAFSVSILEADERVDLEIVRKSFHSQEIVSVVDFLLNRTGATIRDVEEIYTGLGPGSFTGIRVGLSFANTLSETLDIPLVGIPSLDLLAFGSGRWYNSVISFIRSRKNEVYTALYRKGERVGSYRVLERIDFTHFITQEDPACIVASSEDFLDLQFLDLQMEKACEGREIVHSFPRARDALPLSQLCGLRPEKKYLTPLYVRNI